jgi:AraC family transcriptional activator of pobA
VKENFSSGKEVLLAIHHTGDFDIIVPMTFPVYSVFFIEEGTGVYHADFGAFPFSGPTLLFSTPQQQIYLEQANESEFTMIQFHGDFYCIEYHKAQVSCNGLLFNNVYIEPAINLTAEDADLFSRVLRELEKEMRSIEPDEIVLRSYLQLLLAKSSSIKIRSMEKGGPDIQRDEQMERFRQLLEENYLKLHKPNDYARLLSMTANNFSKRCTRYFNKSPSNLI